VRAILLFFVPPFAGAIIGFVTNAIAIKMLFRPLKEIRIFKIRLPFTPGILPRQRQRLAQSIGAMVERELLTPQILRQRLAREDVREKIRESISLFTENVLQKTPGELTAGRENLLSEKIPSAVGKIYPVFSSAVMDFLRRDDIRRELESRGRIFLRNTMFKLNAFQRLFLSAGQYDQTLEEKMPEIIDELTIGAGNLLKNDRVKEKLINSTVTYITRAVNDKDKNLAALFDISMEDKKKLDDFLFQKLTDTADRQIESVLNSINIKTLVSERIDSLDMLRVERIILDVMADQFKWINIFGAILGFLIGLFQSTLNFFLR